MQRHIFIWACVLLSVVGYGQRSQVGINMGYNRVGLFLSPTYTMDINQHQLSVGAKVYGYNLFFQNTPIGLNFGYAYRINALSNSVYFFPAFEISAFKEDKISNDLFLVELTIGNYLGYIISENLSINTGVGFGMVGTRSQLFNTNTTLTSNYLNYEISLGLVYHFGGANGVQTSK